MTKLLKWAYYRFRYNHPRVFGFNPVHLNLELNRSCNCQCRMCYRQNPDWKAKFKDKFMSPRQARIWLRTAKEYGFMSVKFNWRGEPTCAMDLLGHCAEYAKSIGYIDTMINTNGIRKIPAWILKNLTSIAFSLDSTIPEKLEAMRPQARLENILDNLAYTCNHYHGKLIVQRVTPLVNITQESFSDWVKAIIEGLAKRGCRRFSKIAFRENPIEDRSEDSSKFSFNPYARPCSIPSKSLTIGVDSTFYICPYAYYEQLGTELSTNNFNKAMENQKVISDGHAFPDICQQCPGNCGGK